MPNKNECYTYFRICGDFDPEEVTALLGIRPRTAWCTRDRRRDGTCYPFSNWETEHCSAYDVEIDRQMQQTLALLRGKEELLSRFRQTHEVMMTLEVVPTVYPSESSPCLAPGLEVMHFCVATGTQLDIDLYVGEE